MLKMAMVKKVFFKNTEMVLKYLDSLFVVQESYQKNMLPTQFKRGGK